jgi:MinD-like ATPase involved in chromosome partitioning or flagellar assembly
VLTRNQKKKELEGVLPRLQRSYTIGLIAAKGGLGCSTLSLALGLLLREISDREVIVAEYRPGQGSLGYVLHVDDPLRVPQLFDVPLADLTIEHIENILFHYSLPGSQDDSSMKKEIRLLLSSSFPGESKYIHQTELYKMITHLLSKICGFLILDLGTSLNPIAEKTLEQCDELIVITDTVDYTVRQTKALIHALNSYGFNGNKVEVFVHNARSATLSGYTTKKEDLENLNQYASLFVLEHLTIREIEEHVNLPVFYNEDGFPTYWKAVKHLANHINEHVSLSSPQIE